MKFLREEIAQSESRLRELLEAHAASVETSRTSNEAQREEELADEFRLSIVSKSSKRCM